MSENFVLVPTRSGHTSLRSVERNETFHPVIGPKGEATILYVEQQRIVERAAAGDFVLWDVGLGAGANALAAVEALLPGTGRVEIHSFDISLAPLLFALENAEALVYPRPYVELVRRLLVEKVVEVRPGFIWHLHLGDFRELVRKPGLPAPSSIFYDPYSPYGNQEMWTLDHFRALRERLDPAVPCLLTNYTRSSSVRVTLLLAGFFVGQGVVVGDKAETTIASNRLELLERPLGDWFLKRVRISRNAAPMRGHEYAVTPIMAEDLAELEKHPQFCL